VFLTCVSVLLDPSTGLLCVERGDVPHGADRCRDVFVGVEQADPEPDRAIAFVQASCSVPSRRSAASAAGDVVVDVRIVPLPASGKYVEP
jgi:hypothetical protein